jgi:hypothetical protein
MMENQTFKRGLLLYARLAEWNSWSEQIWRDSWSRLGLNTIRAYARGWAELANFLAEEGGREEAFWNNDGMIRMFCDFLSWCMHSPPDEEDSKSVTRIPASLFNTMYSANSTMLSSIFSAPLASNNIVISLKKCMNKMAKKGPKYETMWDACVLLDYFRNNPLPREVPPLVAEVKDFMKRLQGKVACLVMFFAGLRPCELLSIDLKWIVEDNGIIFSAKSKSIGGCIRTYWLPIIEEEAICPVKVMERLRQINLSVWRECNILFADLDNNKPVSQDKLRVRMREVMNAAGIADKYGVYTCKHAAVSFLLSEGFPVQLIEEVIHYRKRDSIVTNHYGSSVAIKQAAKLLAKATKRGRRRPREGDGFYLINDLRMTTSKKPKRISKEVLIAASNKKEDSTEEEQSEETPQEQEEEEKEEKVKENPSNLQVLKRKSVIINDKPTSQPNPKKLSFKINLNKAREHLTEPPVLKTFPLLESVDQQEPTDEQIRNQMIKYNNENSEAERNYILNNKNIQSNQNQIEVFKNNNNNSSQLPILVINEEKEQDKSTLSPEDFDVIKQKLLSMNRERNQPKWGETATSQWGDGPAVPSAAQNLNGAAGSFN